MSSSAEERAMTLGKQLLNILIAVKLVDLSLRPDSIIEQKLEGRQAKNHPFLGSVSLLLRFYA